MSDLIHIELSQRVLTLRFNRPDKKNAITRAMYTTLAEALTTATDDARTRAVLFVGAGDAFTSGNDLQDFLQAPPQPDEDAPVARFMRTLADFPKPALAAIRGSAIGIGTTLLLHCDLIYAGRSARLQMPFVNLGICPEFASSLLLPRIMGHARAAELLLLGEPFAAEQARDYGLVNAVLDDDAVEAHALAQARKLAAKAPNAVRVTKTLLRHWQREQVFAAIGREAEHFLPMLRQPEATEALTAFMQKRAADFSRFE
ncbi:MAG: enoyl-CoA hydratase [Gammaproteobacteria bacterium]|nr:enoyl-CoA hydratase [Gammaproteobacteria bacterium]